MASEAAATIMMDSNEAVQTRPTALLAENPAGFDRILAAFRRDLRPANFTEDILVQRMARHFWGTLRTTRLETALVIANALGGRPPRNPEVRRDSRQRLRLRHAPPGSRLPNRLRSTECATQIEPHG